MVTAIVIPIICIYFFWLTKIEMKEHDIKWLASGHVRQEAIIIGEIKSIIEEKQRYYYHRYIYVMTVKLQTSTKLITATKITPITKNMEKESFTVGEVIRLYGSWEGSKFLISHYENKEGSPIGEPLAKIET